MIFWRKKNNSDDRDKSVAEDSLLHPKGEPEVEPPVEYDSDLTEAQKDALEQTDADIINDLSITPTPDVASTLENSRDDEGGWLSLLKNGLARTTSKLSEGLGEILGGETLDEDTLQNLEDLLITSDVGPYAAAEIVGRLREIAKDMDDKSAVAVKAALVKIMTDMLTPAAIPLNIQKPAKGPRVFLICGVNGVGKTTTIGKLAYQMHFKMGRKVMLAAGDTFRAAALEQLQVWSERVGCKLITRDVGSDPAALAYEAYADALAEDADVLMIDTAGRLHNKANLMAELEKIVRVLRKHDENLPHEVLLVLDATTGQNAIAQVETFMSIVNVTGLIVTKLDGSARGGILLALVEQTGLPVFAVGVGEQIDQLQPFRAAAFAEALVE